MPAQWPTFIKNLSSELESGNSSTINAFAEFLANEYFNTVKDSQTTFGNTHISGQKLILEQGFKESFKEIYDNESVDLEDKKEIDSYADFFEPLPNTGYDFDPLCEVEKYTIEEQDNLNKFNFFSLFESTCPVNKEIDIYAGIDFNKLIKNNTENANQQIQDSDDGNLYVTLSIINFTPGVKYSFLHSINNVDQPITLASDDGILHIRADKKPGLYTYTFKSVLDNDGNIIKEINKSVTVEIKESGEAENITIIKDPNKDKKPRPLVPEMTEDEKILAIASRIVLQSDGSKEFKNWVKRLKFGYNKSFGKKVENKVFELFDTVETIADVKNKIPILSDTNLIVNRNQYIFQSEHLDDVNIIPEWLTPQDYICKFTYVPRIDAIKDDDGDNINIISDFKKNEDEKKRINNKINLYNEEKKNWHQLLRNWGNSNNSNTGENEDIKNGDGYNIMAKSIIDYWKSTGPAPFKPTPPIPPCNIPTPGLFTSISYGDENTLANDLRRSWNTGKSFDKKPLTPAASKAVASAVAVSCSKHLLEINFLYIGSISTPVGPSPMVGFVPLII